MEVFIESVGGSNHKPSEAGSSICSLSIPNNLLMFWYIQRKDSSCQESYIQLLNESHIGNAINICDTAERVENILRRRAGELNNKLSNISRRVKEKLQQKFTTLIIFSHEVVSPSQIDKENSSLTHSLEEAR